MKYFLSISLTILSINAFSQYWNSINNGFDRTVRCLYNDSVDGILYAGGTFIYSDSIKVRGVAAWNGSVWDSLGKGVDASFSGPPQSVLTISKFQNNLYVGGLFSQTGDLYTDWISRWNGNAWDSVELKFNGAVGTLKVINEKLYACGDFDSVGNIAVNGLIKYDGAVWSSVFNLPNFNQWLSGTNVISDLEIYNGYLYVAGNFEGQNGENNIVYWDSVSWKPLGNGIVGSSGIIETMAVYKNELYVGGLFQKSEGNVGNIIQKWNGSTWSEVGNSLYPGQVHKLMVIDSFLYAVGSFSFAGDIPAKYIAKWDGTIWCGLGSDFDNRILSICSFNGDIIIGGAFTNIDGYVNNRISQWTGGSFVDTCSLPFNSIPNYFTVETCQLRENPVHDILEVNTISDQPKWIYINSLLGQEIFRENCSTDIFRFDVSSLQSGIYFLSIVKENGKSTTLFIKE